MKCCAAVKSCAEKLNIFLVYKDQRSPQKKTESEFPVQMGKI